MNDTIVLGLLGCVVLVVAGLVAALIMLALSLDRQRTDNTALVSKMSDQVVATSEYQLDRMKITAHADVAKNYTENVIAPRVTSASSVGSTFPAAEQSDFVTEER